MEYAVLVDPEKCIGCRGCQVTCKRWNNKPAVKTGFSNEWTNPPKLSYNTYTHIQFKLDKKGNGDTDWAFFNWRCMQCHDPACKEACPVNATIFGERDELIAEARRRIKNDPRKYIDHIWGEHEVGGTSVLYISDIDLGFLSYGTQTGTKSLPSTFYMCL